MFVAREIDDESSIRGTAWVITMVTEGESSRAKTRKILLNVPMARQVAHEH